MRFLHQLYPSIVLHSLYIKFIFLGKIHNFCDLAPTYLCNLLSHFQNRCSSPNILCYFTLLCLCRCYSLCIPHKFQTSSTSCYIQPAGECYLYFNTFLSSKLGVPLLNVPKATLTCTVLLTVYSAVFTPSPKVPLRWATFS